MNGILKLGEMIQAKYDRMVLRVRQREDCLRASVYDSGVSNPERPIWESDFQDFDAAKETAASVAHSHLNRSGPIPALDWKSQNSN